MSEIDPVSEKDGKNKKSQKRADRQARKRARRALREKSGSYRRLNIQPVRARLSRKSLPGFMAKNAAVVLQWLKDYMLLFILADDYGISKLDRIPEERRRLLVQNYVDVGDFVSTLQNIMAQAEMNRQTEQTDVPCRETENPEIVSAG